MFIAIHRQSRFDLQCAVFVAVSSLLRDLSMIRMFIRCCLIMFHYLTWIIFIIDAVVVISIVVVDVHSVSI